jgi:hypothetical protein
MPKDHELSAYRFHSDLFLSGFERIILVRLPLKEFHYYSPILGRFLARRQRRTIQRFILNSRAMSTMPTEPDTSSLIQYQGSLGWLPQTWPRIPPRLGRTDEERQTMVPRPSHRQRSWNQSSFDQTDELHAIYISYVS